MRRLPGRILATADAACQRLIVWSPDAAEARVWKQRGDYSVMHPQINVAINLHMGWLRSVHAPSVSDELPFRTVCRIHAMHAARPVPGISRQASKFPARQPDATVSQVVASSICPSLNARLEGRWRCGVIVKSPRFRHDDLSGRHARSLCCETGMSRRYQRVQHVACHQCLRNNRYFRLIPYNRISRNRLSLTAACSNVVRSRD